MGIFIGQKLLIILIINTLKNNSSELKYKLFRPHHQVCMEIYGILFKFY